MSTPSPKLDIIVDEKLPVDAMKSYVDGVTTLFLKPQTFDHAVEHVRSVLPGITVEAAEHMVRTQCPEFRSFDDLLGPATPPAPRVDYVPAAPLEEAPKERFLPRKRRRQAVLIAALLPALAASWSLGRYTSVVDPAPSSTGAADITPTTAGPGQTVPAPFADTRFEHFAGSSDIACSTVSALAAECTDADGMVMSTKAATGPDSTIFTFSYGSERIGLRIFHDPNYADIWGSQDGSREMYPNMQVHGRYALWGTDTDRIAEYVQLLEEADRNRYKGPSPSAMGKATPLPPRLAALTLGTLGLTRQEVQRIMAGPAYVSSDGPALLAARLVLGLESRSIRNVLGGDDIVALAAGFESNRSVDGSAPPVVEATPEPSVPPAVPPVSIPVPETAPPVTRPPATPEPTPTPTPTTTPPVTTPPVVPPPPTSPPPTTTPPTTPSPLPPTKPPVVDVPAPPEPVPSEPEPPVPPKDEATPAPSPNAPAPVEPPTDQPAPPGDGSTAPDGSEDQGADDDLLIVNSAWTVAGD